MDVKITCLCLSSMGGAIGYKIRKTFKYEPLTYFANALSTDCINEITT